MSEPEGEQRAQPLPLSFTRQLGALLFVAGHGAIGDDGQFTATGFEAQFRYTLEELRRTLHDAGTGLDRVMMVHSYVRDPADLPLYNRLYREYFTQPFPARTTLTGCLREGLDYEIDCIATLPPSADPESAHR